MIRYMIRRLLWAMVLFLAVTVVSYVLFYVIPADPAKQACGQACTAADVARVRHFLGLDRPIWYQYWHFLSGIFVVACVGLLVSVLWSFVAVHKVLRPRGARFTSAQKGRELMWQDHVLLHQDNEEYFSALRAASPELSHGPPSSA